MALYFKDSNDYPTYFTHSQIEKWKLGLGQSSYHDYTSRFPYTSDEDKRMTDRYMKPYKPVFINMRTYVKYFFCWNVIYLVLALLFTVFKAKKGFMAKLKRVFLLGPLVSLVFLVLLWQFRLQYESRVCFCDFKDSLIKFYENYKHE